MSVLILTRKNLYQHAAGADGMRRFLTRKKCRVPRPMGDTNESYEGPVKPALRILAARKLQVTRHSHLNGCAANLIRRFENNNWKGGLHVMP